MQVFFAHLIYMCKSEESLLWNIALLNHTTDINLSARILQKDNASLTYTQTFATHNCNMKKVHSKIMKKQTNTQTIYKFV